MGEGLDSVIDYSDDRAVGGGSMTEVFKVRVFIEDEIGTCDGIEWQGKLWLVPLWIDSKGSPGSTPLRAIRFDTLPHRSVNFEGLRYWIDAPLPKSLFSTEGPSTPMPGFEVEVMPGIQSAGSRH